MSIVNLVFLAIALFVLPQAEAQTGKNAQSKGQRNNQALALASASFLGISLDQPFPGERPACPRDKISRILADIDGAKALGVPCYHEMEADKFQVWNGPDLGLGHILEVRVFEGVPLSFRFQVGRTRFMDMVEIFRAKFGDATGSHSETAWTRDGKSFPARELYWEGSRLRITLREVGKDVRWGEAEIESVQVKSALDARKATAVKEAAGRL